MSIVTDPAFIILSERAVQQWGTAKQIIKTIEECAELQVVLSKWLNYSPITNAPIVDEIADALITVNQMRLHFGAEEVDARIKYKLERLEKALNKYNNATTYTPEAFNDKT